ncbi:hypothetical protein NT04LM_4135 [Listeria monocytogenes FSL F2-208]|nr:hypothetical protein NT04LM_4135 [Listeria monocytogenes FSL F2-208]
MINPFIQIFHNRWINKFHIFAAHFSNGNHHKIPIFFINI